MNLKLMQRHGFVLIFLVVSLTASTGRASQPSSSNSKLPIEIVREAYLGAKTNLTSGIGVGTYEHYTQKLGTAKMSLRVKADAKIWFDNGKYHIFLVFNQNINHVRSLRIVYDGDMLMKTEESVSPVSKKSLTRTQLFAADDPQRSPNQAGFPFNPSNLADAVFYMGLKFDRNRDRLRFTSETKGGYLCRCPYGKDRMEFDVLPQFGFNVSASRIFNEGKNRPVAESEAVWKQTGGIWFVKSISDSFYPHSSTASKDVLTYTEFQPNVAVDKVLFRVAALHMSSNSRIIDRRPTAAHKVYRNQPLSDTSAAEVDRMAEYINTLPPEGKIEYNLRFLRFAFGC